MIRGATCSGNPEEMSFKMSAIISAEAAEKSSGGNSLRNPSIND